MTRTEETELMVRPEFQIYLCSTHVQKYSEYVNKSTEKMPGYKSGNSRAVSVRSYLLNIVFVQYNGSVVEKWMIEGVWKQPTELHSSTTVQGRPAVLQAEADKA